MADVFDKAAYCKRPESPTRTMLLVGIFFVRQSFMRRRIYFFKNSRRASV